MMKRVLLSAALAVATSGLLVTTAVAAPPEPAFPGGEVEGICDFPVRLDFTGKVKFIEHGDRAITVAPGQRVKITNLETGESVSYNVSGSFHDQTQPDGSLISKGAGRNLLFTSELGLLVTVGNVSFTVREDPSAPEGFTITIDSRKGRIVDVCAVLA